MKDDITRKITQLRKGILELAILSALNRSSHYGYSLIRAMTGDSTLEITEGTIYPILRRLHQEGLVRSEWVESTQGPPRKYYSLTMAGEDMHRTLGDEFRKLTDLVRQADALPSPGPDPTTGASITIGRNHDRS